MGCENLKKLEPDKFHTGKWNFSGKNLNPQEVSELSRRGVNWDEDVMPDGRLKHPKHRLNRKKTTVFPPSMTREQVDSRLTQLWDEYRQLPDPKPDYIEWASGQTRKEQFDELFTVSRTSQRLAERIKALSTLLEFSKTKPKAQIELSGGESDFASLNAEELLRSVLELNGISFDKFKEFAQALESQPS